MGYGCNCNKGKKCNKCCKFIDLLIVELTALSAKSEVASDAAGSALEKAICQLDNLVEYDAEGLKVSRQLSKALHCYGSKCGYCNVNSCKCRKLEKELDEIFAAIVKLDEEALCYAQKAQEKLKEGIALAKVFEELDAKYQKCISCKKCDCECDCE